MSAASSSEVGRPRALAMLAAILVLGAWMRGWGLGFGMPHAMTRPGEELIVKEADRTLQGHWSPKSYAYPPLFAKLSAGVRWSAVRLFAGAGAREASLFDVRWAYLSGRALSALAGTLTLVLLYVLGRSVDGRELGLAAAFLLSLTHLHVRDSHFGVTDVSLTLAVVLALVAAMRVVQRPSAKSSALAGAAVGLACAVKYPGLSAGLAVLAAHLVVHGPRRDWRTLVGRLVVCGLACVVAFAVACPALVFEPARLFADLLREFQGKTSLEDTPLANRGWIRHALYSLRYGLGIPLLLASVVGLGALLRGRPAAGIVVLAFVGPYYLVIGSGGQLYERYMLPLVPCLCLGAAFLAIRLAARTRWPGPVAVVLCLALVSVSAWRAVLSNRLLATEDTRVVAARRLDELVGEDERVLMVGRYGVPAEELCRGPRFTFETRPFLEDLLRGAPDPGRALRERFDYVVLDDSFRGSSRFEPSPVTRRRLLPHLELVLSISPLARGIERDDVHPVVNGWFYVPFARFEGVVRPGPFLYVFRVREADGK